MTAAQFEYSFLVSVLAIAVYLAAAIFHRQTPDLTQAMIIATSSTSAVAAVFVGVITYSTPSEQLGVLREHKAAVITGTLALIWVSFGAAYNSLMHPRRCAHQARRTA
jgi:hypothetical protein